MLGNPLLIAQERHFGSLLCEVLFERVQSATFPAIGDFANLRFRFVDPSGLSSSNSLPKTASITMST